MSEVRSNLHYAPTHEWLDVREPGVATIGVSDFAQSQLGDLVYVELPEVGTAIIAGSECAVIESVKAAGDIYSPVSGEIAEVNEGLVDNPELISDLPYEDGWLFKVKMSDEGEIEQMLDAEQYQLQIEESE